MKTLSAAILIALLFVLAGCPKEDVPAPTEGDKTVDSVTITPPDKGVSDPGEEPTGSPVGEETKPDGGESKTEEGGATEGK
jgi:hypothetical protein